MADLLSILPQELLDEIIGLIEGPGDLLSLSLTSRAFSHLIIPWHIEYRWIRCSILRTNVWVALSKYPRLAARLRKLELIPEEWSVDEEEGSVDEEVILPRSLLRLPEYEDEGKRSIVPTLTTNLDPHQETALLMDLLKNTKIVSFAYHCSHDGTLSLPILLPKLFQYAPGLQELQIKTAGKRSPPQSGMDIFNLDTVRIL